jgi:16S rRNA (cytidine1402-2'-O)-methyltransferase
VLGNRQAAVARELTKLHEEILRGSLADLVSIFNERPPKGEIVIVIERAGEEVVEAGSISLPERVADLESEGLDHKTALKKAAKEFGLGKSEAYRILQAEKTGR